ncbi:transmembrane protein 32 [Stagonosporopsis vannaccii]|nr:transmembrane protein 32 [Stagonosporopsis vannaccii]
MAFFGTVLNTVGALFLTHAVYSAHEHTTAFANTPLPLDITLELLVGVFMLSTGIVASADRLKPIQISKWASQISREGRHGEGRYTREGEEILSEGDPYAFLGLDGGIGGKGEGRRGFWDVKGKRKEYEEWVRGKQ